MLDGEMVVRRNRRRDAAPAVPPDEKPSVAFLVGAGLGGYRGSCPRADPALPCLPRRTIPGRRLNPTRSQRLRPSASRPHGPSAAPRKLSTFSPTVTRSNAASRGGNLRPSRPGPSQVAAPQAEASKRATAATASGGKPRASSSPILSAATVSGPCSMGDGSSDWIQAVAVRRQSEHLSPTHFAGVALCRPCSCGRGVSRAANADCANRRPLVNGKLTRGRVQITLFCCVAGGRAYWLMPEVASTSLPALVPMAPHTP